MAMMEIGTHAVEVVESGITESRQKNKQLAVTFRNQRGDTITDYWTLTEKTMKHAIGKLREIGWDPASNGFDILPLNDPETSPIVGLTTTIIVTSETYLGKDRKRVSKVGNYEAGGNRLERLGQGDATAFAQQMRAKMQAASGMPNPAGAPASAPNDDSDLPF